MTKFNPQGNALIYSTYLGGANGVRAKGKANSIATALAVDKNGCAYVTGYTYSTDFPTRNPYQADHQGNQCIFVTKFNAQGNDLVYSTYLGGSGNNSASGIAVDQDLNAYIAGRSDGDFPTLNAFQPDYGGGSWDAVVAKFNTDGSNLIYATYLGGEEDDRGGGIAVDNSGNAYVTGRAGSGQFSHHCRGQAAVNGGFHQCLCHQNQHRRQRFELLHLSGGRGLYRRIRPLASR